MGIILQIANTARERRLEFVVIGGLAVNYHGVSRDTADLDLLVCRADRKRWCELLLGLHYTVWVERPAFIQFSPAPAGTWPVDLMLVEAATFTPMFDAGVETNLYDAEVKIVSIEHLLALKLHALKHSHLGRYSKDLLDVEHLVRVNLIDLAAEKTRQLFLKYGNLKIYEQISRFAAEQ